MSDHDSPEPTVHLLDLRDIEATVQARISDDEREYLIILSDGRTRLALTGGPGRRNSAAVFGAQRVAIAFIDYAAGLALLNMPLAETERR